MKKSIKRSMALVLSLGAILASGLAANAAEHSYPYAYNIKKDTIDIS